MKNFHCCYRSESVFTSTTVEALDEQQARKVLAVMFPETRESLDVWELRELQSGPPPLQRVAPITPY